jgi:hypothetical protein
MLVCVPRRGPVARWAVGGQSEAPGTAQAEATDAASGNGSGDQREQELVDLT